MTIGSVGAGHDAQAMMQMQRSDAMQIRMQHGAGMRPPGDAAMFSKGAERMEQLAQLASKDPEAFKEAAANIADKLDEEAAGASGHKANMLGKIAEKFRDASESGNINDLRPDGPPPGMGGMGGMRSLQGMSNGRGAFASSFGAEQFTQTLDLVDATVEQGLNEAGGAAA